MNNITIAGQLGRDAELRATNKGESVCSFSVADSAGKDKPTIWWSCQLWGKRADVLSQYLTKGQSVTVSGTVSEREWADKTTGEKRKSMEIRVNDVALQGGKPQERQEQRQAPRQAPTAAPKQSSGFDDFPDMDVPW